MLVQSCAGQLACLLTSWRLNVLQFLMSVTAKASVVSG
jgi:hypothetical protein